MSQRLSDSAVSDLEARGLARFTKPIGHRKNGSPIFPIGGASPEDDSNGTGGTGGSEGGSGTGSEGQGGEVGGKTGEEGAGGNKAEETTVTKAEFDQLMERMKAADRNKSAAEQKLRELEEKDLSEQEKIAKRLPELEQQNQQLAEENKGLKAKVAFLGLEGVSWHDPDVALGQVDLSEVTKDDGTIDKGILKKAVEKLSKDKPFLVKSSAKEEEGAGGNGQGSGGGSGQGSSGSPVGAGKPGQKGGLDEAALRKKYPALN